MNKMSIGAPGDRARIDDASPDATAIGLLRDAFLASAKLHAPWQACRQIRQLTSGYAVELRELARRATRRSG
jgi:hypothetical protein